MPWKEASIMDQRAQFIALAKSNYLPFKKLCQQFGVSRTTGYKWFNRSLNAALQDAIKDQSKKPKQETKAFTAKNF